LKKSMQPVNLFCLPFAGGNKYCYRSYETAAPDFLRIKVLEYPGRGLRMNEPLNTDVNQLTNDLYEQISGQLDKEPYAIYGHSMGGLMACLLSRKIIANNHVPPLHVFITGTSGPSAESRGENKRHLLEKKEFIEELKRLNGSPDEVLQNEELLDFFEPIIRADFKATETYTYEASEMLNIPFTVITGTEEGMTLEDIQLWQKETAIPVDFKRLPGKHFFIYQYTHQVIKIISKKVFNHLTYQL